MQGSREQLAIAEFANALLVIPKTLAVNAAKDSTELVAKLRAYHNAAQSAPTGDPKRALRHYGLDLMKGEVRDNVKAGVLEPMISKIKSLKSALEACTALLRIDDRVRLALSLPLRRCPLDAPRRVSVPVSVVRDADTLVHSQQITVPPEQKGEDPHGH